MTSMAKRVLTNIGIAGAAKTISSPKGYAAGSPALSPKITQGGSMKKAESRSCPK